MQKQLQTIVEEETSKGPNYRCEFRVEERPWDRGAFAKDRLPMRIEKNGDQKGNDSDSDTGMSLITGTRGHA